MAEGSRKPAKDLHTICGWCGKSEADGAKLIAGPVTCICDPCCRLVAAAFQIIPPELIEQTLADSTYKLPEMAKDDGDK